LAREFQLPICESGGRIEKVSFPCERCGARAQMIFERTVLKLH
jgi:hypothetical protein